MGVSILRRPWGPAALLSFVVLLGTGAAPAAAACPDEQLSTTDPAATPARLRAAVVCLVNEARNAHGLWSLNADPQLEQAAQSHTDDMANRNYFDHTTPEGQTPDQRVSATGYEWGAVAENLALGAQTPFAVMEQWLGSQAHCQNIFSTKVLDIGVGVRQDKDLWTQVFARRKKDKKPKDGTEVPCPSSMGRAAGGDSPPPVPAPAPGSEVSSTSSTGTPGVASGNPGNGNGGANGKANAGGGGQTSATPTIEAQGPPTLVSVKLAGRAVKVVAACDGAGSAPVPCRLQASVSGPGAVKRRKQRMGLGTASATVPAGQSVTFTLTPNAAGRRTLTRGGGRVALQVILRDLRAKRDIARTTLKPLRTSFR